MRDDTTALPDGETMCLRHSCAGEEGDANGSVVLRWMKGQGGVLVPREHC